MTTLPIHNALPDVIAALRAHGRVVLQAPPGAGKTTVVPLALLDAGLCDGRIVMLEPRRLAARAAAERMAETLGEPVGQTVGYRIRGEAKTSKSTRIEVVTEGILTRMIQSDPELTGIGAILFDEFHERSLNADLGLALTWEVRRALRDDLLLVVMSATLDAEPVARLLDDAPVVTSAGRMYPVDIKWLDRPVPKTTRFDAAMADLIVEAAQNTTGGILAFLPGEGEIRRTAARLEGRLPADCTVRPLYGSLPFAEQRAAIAPTTTGRKVVLATSIAETSLTIQDVRVVVDGGQSRRARFDPNSGMSRLVTERTTKAEATQRAGRAGRVAEGTCYRLWTKGEEGGLPPFPPAEIEAADLTDLALELALWGSADDLIFLTPPPEAPLAKARALLRDLGALDAGGRITDHGRDLAAMPLHPRLGHMVRAGGPRAIDLAALLSERDPMRGAGCDVTRRLRAIENPRDGAVNRGAVERIKSEARRLKPLAGPARDLSIGQCAALAYPDRVGLRRKGDQARFVLSGGKGAVMDDGDDMAGDRLLVALDLDGDTREARIRLAAPISEGELRALYPDQIDWHDLCEWSKRERRVIARRQERFGALVLDDRIWKDAPPEAVARAMLDGVRDLGLPWSDPARRLRARIDLLREQGADFPDTTDAALIEAAEDWLLPYLNGIKTAEQLKNLDLTGPLKNALSWEQQQDLDRLAPGSFTTPLGRKIAIDYAGGTPEIQVRLQEMFGQTTHPTVGPSRAPLKITLLSPAQRPVQTTMDLPGFWTSSYADVRKDMRGRYPRHPWPEDPTVADPTLRAKPRGT